MKKTALVTVVILLTLILTACTKKPTPATIPSAVPETAESTQPDEPTQVIVPTESVTLAPEPTVFTTDNWSSTAATKTELSFTFPGQWDGSSPLTFGEGEFVKDPDQATGVTFQTELQGDPAALLEAWGDDQVGIVGISTFLPDNVDPGPEVEIARIPCQTRIASNKEMKAQVTYIQREKDVLEVMWFSPLDQWESLQPTFEQLLKSVEIWKEYTNMDLGLHSMYVHDWMKPAEAWEPGSVKFLNANETSGVVLLVDNEIADPVEKLNAWSSDRLGELGLSACTIEQGDRMDTFNGQWESKMGECKNEADQTILYEVSFVPDRDRLLEIITFSPESDWQDNNAIAFKTLLAMMVDFRP